MSINIIVIKKEGASPVIIQYINPRAFLISFKACVIKFLVEFASHSCSGEGGGFYYAEISGGAPYKYSINL